MTSFCVLVYTSCTWVFWSGWNIVCGHRRHSLTTPGHIAKGPSREVEWGWGAGGGSTLYWRCLFLLQTRRGRRNVLSTLQAFFFSSEAEEVSPVSATCLFPTVTCLFRFRCTLLTRVHAVIANLLVFQSNLDYWDHLEGEWDELIR